MDYGKQLTSLAPRLKIYLKNETSFSLKCLFSPFSLPFPFFFPSPFPPAPSLFLSPANLPSNVPFPSSFLFTKESKQKIEKERKKMEISRIRESIEKERKEFADLKESLKVKGMAVSQAQAALEKLLQTLSLNNDFATLNRHAERDSRS